MFFFYALQFFPETVKAGFQTGLLQLVAGDNFAGLPNLFPQTPNLIGEGSDGSLQFALPGFRTLLPGTDVANLSAQRFDFLFAGQC